MGTQWLQIKQTPITVKLQDTLTNIVHGERILLMKVFIAALVLIIGLQSLIKANDISEFQIGNFSLNESLLDNYKKDYLINNWERQKHTYGFKSKKYYKFAFFDDKFKPYDQIVLYTLKSDNLFKIKSITGFRENMDIDNCYNEQINISDEIFNLFPNTIKKIYGPSKKLVDPTGKSTEKGIYYVFGDGATAGTACIKYGNEFKKKNSSYANDHMQIYIDTSEYAKWLDNEAWK